MRKSHSPGCVSKTVLVIPIIGARKVSQLQDNLASLDFSVPAEQLKSLDEASRIDLGFPRVFTRKKWLVQLDMTVCGIASSFKATVSAGPCPFAPLPTDPSAF